MTIKRVAITLVCIANTACATVNQSGGEQGSIGSSSSDNFGRRDDRVVIGRASDVQMVSVSRRYVYTATSAGVGIMDRLTGSWQTPLSSDRGFADARITTMAADPVEDAVWFGFAGSIFVYRPFTDQFQRIAIVGIPELIAFDRSSTGDVLVRASGQWNRVTRAGLASQYLGATPQASTLIGNSTLGDVYRQYPALQSQATFLLREQLPDRPISNAQVISGSVAPERGSEVWLGTSNDGLWKIEPNFQHATPYRYGLLENGVGAIARTADGVWISGLGDPRGRGGITYASNDLQRWRWIPGTIARPMNGVVSNAIAVRGSRIWVATDRGTYRIRSDGNAAVERWGTLDGMPADEAFAIAPRDDGAWIGTLRGLVWVSDTASARDRKTAGIGRRVLDNLVINALQFVGDTLWIGTDDGLFALPGRDGVLSRPASTEAALRRPVRALGWSDSALFVVTDDALLHVSRRANVEPTRLIAFDVRQVGRITAMDVDERAVWLAGSDGVAMWQRNGGAPRLLRSNRELPGPALDVVLAGELAWVATPGGLVRLKRSRDGGIQ